MLLIKWEVNHILNWSADCVIIGTNIANKVATFTITATRTNSSKYKFKSFS